MKQRVMIVFAFIVTAGYTASIHAAASLTKAYYARQFEGFSSVYAKLQKECIWEEQFIAQLMTCLPEMDAHIRKARHQDARAILVSERVLWVQFIDERRARLTRLKHAIADKEEAWHRALLGEGL